MASAARSHVHMALREFVETHSKSTFHLYMHVVQQHLTLILLSPPRESASGNVGWLRCFRGELTASLQPPSLSAALKPSWIPRLLEALKGQENAADYAFSVRRSTPAAAAEQASQSKSRRTREDSASHTELKIAYRGSTLLRLPLSALDREGASAADVLEEGASAPTRPLSPFGGYRADTLSMLNRVAALTTDLQTRIRTREEQRTRGKLKLADQIEQLQRKAIVRQHAADTLTTVSE